MTKIANKEFPFLGKTKHKYKINKKQ